MPELPEVETIRRRLCAGDAKCPGLIGRRIQGAWVGWAFQDEVAAFAVKPTP